MQTTHKNTLIIMTPYIRVKICKEQSELYHNRVIIRLFTRRIICIQHFNETDERHSTV